MTTKTLAMVIDGQLRPGKSHFGVTNPATEESAGQVPQAEPQDISAGHRGQGDLRSVQPAPDVPGLRDARPVPGAQSLWAVAVSDVHGAGDNSSSRGDWSNRDNSNRRGGIRNHNNNFEKDSMSPNNIPPHILCRARRQQRQKPDKTRESHEINFFVPLGVKATGFYAIEEDAGKFEMEYVSSLDSFIEKRISNKRMANFTGKLKKPPNL